MPLWIFGSEVNTLIDLCNSSLKLEEKQNSKPEKSTQAQRKSSWSPLHPLGWEKHIKGQ
ncbi:hypothetical protein I79_013018 [Cricetulus griseus]|uniref:Uncharacterized protein n=1 Tax=Cricetulus griseus TaxID=10029 RepID=G3HQC1_CRIGR|nr:hypothetical protein I79_013018 [Cricetulus griseus]